MAFFKSFQQNLPSVNISSLLDSVTSRVDDLANAVSGVTCAVSDQLTEQVTTIISKVEDGETSGQESGQSAAAQEGGSKAGGAASKANQSEANEAESAPSQLEWEWRDGCWRVKKTEAVLAVEEKRKEEEKELQEKKEQRRKERREKQLEKEAVARKTKEESKDGEQEEEADALEEKDNSGNKTTRQQDRRLSVGSAAPPPPSPGREEEVEVADSLEREGDDEEEAELSRSSSTAKKKKSEKKKRKGVKESPERLEEASDVEKEKGKKEKKSKKKKKGKQEGVLSSEEDLNTTSAWSNARTKSTEQGGDGSDASSERAANRIQRKKIRSSVSEPRPPPYRREGSAPRATSRSRSEREVTRRSSTQRCDSEASEVSVDQDTESYLNKGCEEDIPSDSTAVLGPEDGSGLQLPSPYEPEPLAKYGTLDVAFEYDSGEQWLAVTVTAATDIPALKQTGNIAWQVHLVLLPTRTQRAKTGVQKGPCPVFTETFKFSKLEQEALGDYAVRFRLYSIRRMKKEKVLGEKVFYLTKLNLQGKIALPVTLEPGSELTGCGSVVSVSRSAGALSYRSTEDSSLPELLLGLLYNSTTGQLSVEVVQGSHFKTTASDKPVALFQLSEVSLVLSVFCRRSSMRPRERLGWASLGLNSTGEEQQSHWTEMKEAEGQQTDYWWRRQLLRRPFCRRTEADRGFPVVLPTARSACTPTVYRTMFRHFQTLCVSGPWTKELGLADSSPFLLGFNGHQHTRHFSISHSH
ncbi:synaptotagmin-14b isoform X4 [Pseudoliparis swirei]|uniref:synaptotagmin-14b isoform X4 n=1 Tax=Pseudoliparis swirei TaxID=2059687 RepID=UPI0024BEDAC3|nr:synaptotagmin-14b isoform X4 [Pseudoliparis swirei]